MKVKELIELLEKENPETEVCIKERTGNYWRHILAKEIKRLSEETIKYSEYNENYIVADDYSVDDEIKTVIIIS